MQSETMTSWEVYTLLRHLASRVLDNMTSEIAITVTRTGSDEFAVNAFADSQADYLQTEWGRWIEETYVDPAEREDPTDG
jgi:hypothetical protein